MQTAVWGPHTWVLFHTVAFNYPKQPKAEDRARYRRFYGGLAEILPCKYCRVSYSEFVEERPLEPYLRDREGVIYWTYMIHDRVNKKLSKKSCSFEEYVESYENIRAKCAKRANAVGNLVAGCIEPMKNFDSNAEVRAYARRIWETYHDKSPKEVARMDGGAVARADVGNDWLSTIAVATGLITGAVLLARP